jgi:transcriptional regulator GlxA family with amidase domain
MNATVPKLRVGFILAPRFTLTAFSGFVDTLRLAADEDDLSRPIECTWSVLGNPDEPVASSCGVEVKPWEAMREPERFDYLVAVGGLMHGRQEVPPGVKPFFSEAVAAGVPLVGLCTGSFILARFGFLDGYTTCVSWFHRDEFMLEFPHLKVISNRLYVVDRDRLTCAGGTSVVHLAARLIARHQGAAVAEQSLRIMIEDHPLPGSTPQPEQVITRAAHDPIVKRAMLLIEQNLSGSNDLGALSETTGVSSRQLQRRFLADIGISAKEYRARLRLSRAKWLIQHTQMSLSAISFECGFADGAHLSRSFRQYFGTPPSQMRKPGGDRRRPSGDPTPPALSAINPR